jgi:hypothetical protein
MKQQNSIASLEKRLAGINAQMKQKEKEQSEFLQNRGGTTFISNILFAEELFGNTINSLYEEQKALEKKISKTKKDTVSVLA